MYSTEDSENYIRGTGELDAGQGKICKHWTGEIRTWIRELDIGHGVDGNWIAN